MLFRKYGGKVVYNERFIAILRALVAFLAGTTRIIDISVYEAVGVGSYEDINPHFGNAEISFW